MRDCVLDASAVLALLNHEQGFQMVEDHLSHGIISTVNVCEVLSVLSLLGMALEEASGMMHELLHKVLAFDDEQAVIAAELRTITKKLGLSFGDRACLALAKQRELPVLTADKVWAQLKIGVQIQLIR